MVSLAVWGSSQPEAARQVMLAVVRETARDAVPMEDAIRAESAGNDRKWEPLLEEKELQGDTAIALRKLREDQSSLEGSKTSRCEVEIVWTVLSALSTACEFWWTSCIVSDSFAVEQLNLRKSCLSRNHVGGPRTSPGTLSVD